MKHGTTLKLKFRKLSTLLGLSLWQTKGLLQSIWDFTAENTPAGDIGKHSDEDIAMGIEWAGNPSVMINALVQTGWLDRSDKYRLIVHDWQEHCEGWIKKRLQRAGIAFAADNGGQREPLTVERRTSAENGGKPYHTLPCQAIPKKTPLTPLGGGRGENSPSEPETVKTSAIRHAVISEWWKAGVADGAIRRLDRLVRQFAQLTDDPDEIIRRRQRAIASWGSAAKATPEAVLKHWSLFEPEKDPLDE